jgi:chromosome segregation ATPase
MAGRKERPSDQELRGLLEAMRARGEKITVDAFIAAAGGGDRTYLSEFLARWRKEVDAREHASLAELPPAVLGVLAGLGIQLKEVLGTILSEQAEHFQIVIETLRERHTAAASTAAKLAEDLTEARDSLRDQVSRLETSLQGEQRRADEKLLQIDRLKTRVEDLEAASRLDRETFMTLVSRGERDVADAREQSRRSEEARFKAVQEFELTATRLGEVASTLQERDEQLRRAAEGEATLRTEIGRLMERLNQAQHEMEDMRRQRDEERSERAARSRDLRLCRERLGNSAG